MLLVLPLVAFGTARWCGALALTATWVVLVAGDTDWGLRVAWLMLVALLIAIPWRRVWAELWSRFDLGPIETRIGVALSVVWLLGF